MLGIREVAALAGVSTRTIRRYHNAGLMPAPIRLAGRTLLKWRQSEILTWLNGQS
ncbi:MAG: MerR family DNA-binding transcriptional regulator [Candidatus Hydrogenedentes bacterium]|nr:MerR family DNA-binding transcriptional regulator [Candidatus Hydrogenedentota bacterium]